MESTGVAPIPALSNTIGPSPSANVKLPLGALTWSLSPTWMWSWKNRLPGPSPRFTLMR